MEQQPFVYWKRPRSHMDHCAFFVHAALVIEERLWEEKQRAMNMVNCY